jgi:putative hydrolase of the HAD superfamily
MSSDSFAGAIPSVIIFDLGGVLMDFRGPERLAALLGERCDEELRRKWSSSQWHQAFGLGRCTSEEFAEGAVIEWDLDLSPSEFLREFATWPAGPFEGAVELLQTLHGSIPMACLTDTCPTHWDLHLTKWGLVQYFDWTFASHELGMVKPNPKLYDHVIKTIGVAPGRLLFLDDNIGNVRAARRSGMQAQQVRGIAEVRAVLAGIDAPVAQGD